LKKLLSVLALMTTFAVFCTVSAIAQNDAGPNDTARTHDYARPIGSASDRKLSTGWTHGHGSRIYRTHDYLRHTRSGSVIHVHGYYHSAPSHIRVSHYSYSHHYSSHRR
jgi:hypothetical protein